MEQVLLLYGAIFGAALAVTILILFSRGESLPRKWAKIRVRMEDDPSGRMSKPQDDEFDPAVSRELLVIGAALLLLILLLENM